MKSIKNIITVFVMLFAAQSLAAYVNKANISQYTVNIKKIETFNNTTSTWITLSETSSGNVDIASVAAGDQVASMIKAGITLPYGIYTKARATVDDEFKVKACAASGASCMNGAWTSGTTAASTSIATTSATEMTFLINFSTDLSANDLSVNNATAISGGVQIEYTFAAPFVMDATTTSMSTDIAFDLENVFQFTDNGNNTGYINIDFPKVNITVQ